MITNHEITRVEHDAWFTSMLADPSRRYWVIECDGEPVGVVHLADLSTDDASASWGIYIGEPDATGRGVGAGAVLLSLDAAFGPMGLERVTCEVIDANHAARRLYDRMGFRAASQPTSHTRATGDVVTLIPLRIDRDEWDARRPALAASLAAAGILDEVAARG
jgi:UDP-4-amino-4,6-dideoxy-N-acetyl-beta-L-altrosamine N-acetyltransferase